MPKSRIKTRANARKKENEKLTIRSRYGYQDPTPYFALRNIEREQKLQQSSIKVAS